MSCNIIYVLFILISQCPIMVYQHDLLITILTINRWYQITIMRVYMMRQQ